MKKMLFVFNPRPGREQVKDCLMEVLGIFTRAGYKIRVRVTQEQSGAVEVVHQCSNHVDLVTCSGGDGILNETVSGMMKLKKPPLLGYIPAGSTNDFTSSLEIPKRISQAASDTMKGKPSAVDIGTFCHDRYSIYVAAFKAFTEVPCLASQDRKNLLGHQACMIEDVKNLTDLKPYCMKVEWEDQALEEDFTFGMVTNTRSVGGFRGLVNRPMALNNGLFEMLLVRIPRTPVDSSNVVSYVSLKEEPNEYIYKFGTPSIRMTPGQGTDWVLDGEYGRTETEVNIGNLKERIQTLLKK